MSVLIVGDQKHGRQSLAALVGASLPGSQIRQAGSPHEALRVAREVSPRLVILDVRDADLQAMSTAREIRGSCPRTRILVLTLNPCGLAVQPAAWADAIVDKNASPDELLRALSYLLQRPEEAAGLPWEPADCRDATPADGGL